MTAPVRMLSAAAFAVLMIGAAGYRADGVAVAVAAAALVAALLAVWLPVAATAAVLLAVLTVVLAEPAPMYTALAGLAAAAYLILRHSNPTVPTMVFASGFAAATVLALVLPVQAPWVPLAAPLVVLAGYVLAVRPYLTGRG